MIKTEEEIKREIEEKKLTGVPSIDRPYRKFYTDEMLSLEVPQKSLTEYIYDKNKDRLYLNALSYLTTKVSYEELFDRIEQTSARFKKLGVREEDYVGLAMPLTPEAIYMMYGLDNIGASANLIDPRVPEERMRYYLNLTESRLACAIRPYMSTMRRATKNSSVKDVIDVSPIESLSKEEFRELAATYSTEQKAKMLLKNLKNGLFNNLHNAKAMLTNGSTITTYSSLDEEENYVINRDFVPFRIPVTEYTSGTTGIPKALGLTAEGMNITAEQLTLINHAEPGDTLLAIMPPFISYGAVTGIHNSLSAGVDMILIADFSIDKLPALIKKYKPNNLICVPSMFKPVMESDLLKDEDMSYLKRLIFGGDRTLPEYECEVNEWLHKHNCHITVIKGGGMAEYSSCAFETPFEETKKPGIYGIPLPKCQVKIMKDDYTECGYYEVGEIYINSPQQMKGYINNPEETKKFFFVDENGTVWGRSGDLGYIDTDGCVTHTGRKKHMIVRPDGHNVFPVEIERAIMETNIAKNCVVIGVKDEQSVIGEYPHAFIELKEEFNGREGFALAAIKKEVAKKIPVRDRPRDDDYYVSEIVYAKEGKIDREETVKRLKK